MRKSEKILIYSGKFTPEEKARLVLEILKEEKPVSQLASEHGIHTNVLNWWKTEAFQNLSELFVDNRKGITKMKKDYEKQNPRFQL